jgi:hypothetical protein
MSYAFASKVRRIGTSLGVIIPNDVVREEKLKEGKRIELTVFTPNYALLEQLMGSMKGAAPFERDHDDGA